MTLPLALALLAIWALLVSLPFLSIPLGGEGVLRIVEVHVGRSHVDVALWSKQWPEHGSAVIYWYWRWR